MLQAPFEVQKRLEEVRLLESRKSARLADQDTDFARLADMAGDRKRTASHTIDVPAPSYHYGYDSHTDTIHLTNHSYARCTGEFKRLIILITCRIVAVTFTAHALACGDIHLFGFRVSSTATLPYNKITN